MAAEVVAEAAATEATNKEKEKPLIAICIPHQRMVYTEFAGLTLIPLGIDGGIRY